MKDSLYEENINFIVKTQGSKKTGAVGILPGIDRLRAHFEAVIKKTAPLGRKKTGIQSC